MSAHRSTPVNRNEPGELAGLIRCGLTAIAVQPEPFKIGLLGYVMETKRQGATRCNDLRSDCSLRRQMFTFPFKYVN